MALDEADRLGPRSLSSFASFSREESSLGHRNFKMINDPIHGHIKVDSDCIEFMDTIQFQRLRDLKQLGSTYFVFPGGCNNRFEHSVGVCHLAGELIDRISEEQPELEITASESKCVKIAGLCHDLGHGPFSHIFDNEFMPKARPNYKWTHEQASEMMLDYLIDENNIDIEQEEIVLIKSLISGNAPNARLKGERGFLFDIVANRRNSVDVDKFDYIERDCYNLGIKSSYDSKRLMLMCRVVDNQICYHHKEVYNLYEMFHTRYSLFKRIYTHRVAKAIEYMITDTLLEANQHFGIADAVDRPEEYVNLTDDILRSVERSKAPELAKAREIMRRLRTRDLYKFVDECLIPLELRKHLTKEKVTAREIIAYQDDSESLSEDDVLVEWLKINYAMKDRNPVDNVRFYSKFDDTVSFRVRKEQVSFLVPGQFEEVVIRVFTRDPTKVSAVQKCFREMMKVIDSNIVPIASPGRTLELIEGHHIPAGFQSPRKRRIVSNADADMVPIPVVKNWQ